MRNRWIVLSAILTLGMLLVMCNNPKEPIETSTELTWRNHHDTVSYIGMDQCLACHGEIHHTFQHTGMGMSFDRATHEKSYHDWTDKEVIHDEYSNLSYFPYFRDSTLYVKEFRIENGDTVHSLVHVVDYIVGSGQHTNSHIWTHNGFTYQAPFTYYTQEERADLPPGFEDGANSRFSRIIGLECMSCHNAMPTGFQLGSENRFLEIPRGIDCERCHGPGELHVSEKLAGIIVDTALEADRSIVNPRRLSPQLQMELCQRCHLQGNAVLKEGKSFFDFKPGMELSEVMDVYLPRYDDSDNSFIMASHADRLKLSECYIAGNGEFNCISCHNPHVSVRETNVLQFNATCTNCHGGQNQTDCTAETSLRNRVDDNCVSCHMPSSSSNDIPHVSVHDHWIRVPQPNTVNTSEAERTLRALVAINNPNPSNRSKARAFLQQYEQFGGEVSLLDSAWKYIQRLPETDNLSEKVHLFHLRRLPVQIIRTVEAIGASVVYQSLSQKSYDNRQAWTAYRIGEAYNDMDDLETARSYYQKAVDLAPYVLDFQNKLGSASLKLGDIRRAEEVFSKMLELNPYSSEAHNNMGYVQLIYGDTLNAKSYFISAVENNPDYVTARLNLISTYAALGEVEKAKSMLRPLLESYPDNDEFRRAMLELQGRD